MRDNIRRGFSFESITINVMTLQDFNTIVSHERLTLVDFYATWCGPCKATHKILDRLEETMNGTLDIIRIDIDHHENTDLVNHYRIMAVPTLILFRRGQRLWRECGVLTVETLAEIIRRYDKVETY